jgi:EpsI family protein
MSTYLINIRNFFGIAVFGFVFFDVLVRTVKGWTNFGGSHGPVILAISLYMVWTKREKLRDLVVQPNLFAGALVTTLGCVIFILGKIGSIMILQFLAFIITLAGMVLLLWGLQFFKALVVPIGYLVFMSPLFSIILGSVSIYLQDITAGIAYVLLKSGGILVYKSSHLLELPYMSLEVAEACNGINHIMALVSLAIPLSYINRYKWVKSAILAISAFLIGIFLNGLRVAVIGFWVVYKKGEFAHGPFDMFYVSFIFFFGMVTLILFSKFIGRFGDRGRELRQVTTDHEKISHFPHKNGSLAYAVTILLLFLTGIYLQVFNPRPVYLAAPLMSLPLVIGSWTGKDIPQMGTPFSEFSAETELKRVYRDDKDNEIKLYIGYFSRQDKETINYRFDSLQRDATIVKIPLEDRTTDINSTPAYAEEGLKAVYFYYNINGRILTNRHLARLATIADGLMKRRTNAAVVVIAPINGTKKMNNSCQSEGANFIKTVLPLIQKSLST